MVDGRTYDLGLLLGREVGVRVRRHVMNRLIVAAVGVARRFLSIVAHVVQLQVKPFLRFTRWAAVEEGAIVLAGANESRKDGEFKGNNGMMGRGMMAREGKRGGLWVEWM